MKNLSFDFIDTPDPIMQPPHKKAVRKIKVQDEATIKEEKLSAEIDSYFYSHAQGYLEPNLAPLRISRRRNKTTYYNMHGTQRSTVLKKYVLAINNVVLKAVHTAQKMATNAKDALVHALNSVTSAAKSGWSYVIPKVKKHAITAVVIINLLATLFLGYLLLNMQQSVNANTQPSMNSEVLQAHGLQIEALKTDQATQAAEQGSRYTQQQNQLNCLSTQQYLSQQQENRTLTASEKDALRSNCAN